MKKNQTTNSNLIPKTSSNKKNNEKSVVNRFEKIRINKTPKNLSTNLKDEVTKNEQFLISNRLKKENVPLTTSRKESSRRKFIASNQSENLFKTNMTKHTTTIRQKYLNTQLINNSKSSNVNMTNSYSDMAKKLKMNKKTNVSNENLMKITSRNSTDNHSSMNLISKTTVSAKNSHCNTENNKCFSSFSGLDFESPEELHYFYVMMSQKNKVLAYKFEGERIGSINTINSINAGENNIKVDEV